MQKTLTKTSLVLLLVLSFSFFAFPQHASAAERSVEGIIVDELGSKRTYLSPKGVKSKTVWSYPSVSLYINGKKASYLGRLINGEVYVPARKAIEGITGSSVSYNSSTRTLTSSSYRISVSDGAYVIYAADRPLFSMTPSVILSDGAMYCPISTLSAAIGMQYELSETGAANIKGRATPIAHAQSYYREDEVYWLSRIINAESKGESLLGQIAVGNVVLNRVKSNQYPNTIWSVIFDRKYGVQFSPVLDGSIYSEPSYTSILAAKICLEGFRISNNALFFLYPHASTSSWIPANRQYEFSIGKHDFYS